VRFKDMVCRDKSGEDGLQVDVPISDVAALSGLFVAEAKKQGVAWTPLSPVDATPAKAALAAAGDQETPKVENVEAPAEPKEEAKEAVKDAVKKDDPADKAAKAAEKLMKSVIKEGGKKGVEIEGASDMGGLDFFCTTIETPDGDVELLHVAMTAMNAQPDPEAEDRKGCSGHVGKMIFSAGTKQLAIVAYVPEDKAGKVEITEWMEHVAASVAGKLVGDAAVATSPNGGKVIGATVAADADRGKFPIKDKDTAMAAAFAFLRSKGAFPDDDGDDDDDEVCFGDDAFDNIDEL